MGPHRDDPAPILLYSAGKQDEAVADFLTYANEIRIPSNKCMILAHNPRTLPKALTGPPHPPSSSTNAFIWAVGTLNEFPSAPARTKDLANDIVARTILRTWYADADDQTPEETLRLRSLDAHQFQRLQHRVRNVLPSLDLEAGDWVRQAKTIIAQFPPTPSAPKPTSRLRAPGKSGTARKYAELPAPTVHSTARPRLSTVHQAKGDQAQAVMICMPGRKSEPTETTIIRWLSGDLDSESIRVLYVAATRAQRLLALTVPPKFLDAIETFIKDQGIATARR